MSLQVEIYFESISAICNEHYARELELNNHSDINKAFLDIIDDVANGEHIVILKITNVEKGHIMTLRDKEPSFNTIQQIMIMWNEI